MDLAARAKATDAVLDRYRDKPFDWAGANCIRLARAQAAALGHDVPPVPMFRTALGAKRALKKRGVETVIELLDDHLLRLKAPAFMLLGDICTLQGDVEGLDAVCIADGLGNLIGWHENKRDGLAAIKFAQADISAAWGLAR